MKTLIESLVATRFAVPSTADQDGGDTITIERRCQLQGPAKWAVKRGGNVLCKDGSWEFFCNGRVRRILRRDVRGAAD